MSFSYSEKIFTDSISRIQGSARSGNFKSALFELEELLEWLPLTKLNFESLVIIANLCDSAGLNKFSVYLFNLLHELYPSNHNIVYRKALSAYKSGDTESAFSICKGLPLEYWANDLTLSFLVLLAIKLNEIDFAKKVIKIVFSEKKLSQYQGVLEHAIRIAYFHENNSSLTIDLIEHLDKKRKGYHACLWALAAADLYQYDSAFETLGLNRDARAKRRYPSKEYRRNALIAGYEVARRQSGYEQSLMFINQLFDIYEFAPIVRKSEFLFSSLHCDVEKMSVINSGYLVSIIMTVHQWNDYFPIAIDTILNQTYKNLELIIVVDGSADNLINKEIESSSRRDSRVRIERLDKNQGTYVAKNLGIKKSNGDFIAFMDSDDWSHPQRIEKAINQFRSQGKNLLAVVDNSIRLLADGQLMIRNRLFTFSAPISLVIRKSAVLENIGFFDEVRCSADSEYLFRIQSIAGKSAVSFTGAVTIIQSFGEYCLTGGGSYAYAWRGLDKDRLKYRNSFLTWHKLAKLLGSDRQLKPQLENRKWHAPKVMLSDDSLYDDNLKSNNQDLVNAKYPKLKSLIDRLSNISSLGPRKSDAGHKDKKHELVAIMLYSDLYESRITFAIASLLNQSLPLDSIYVYNQGGSKPRSIYNHPKVKFLDIDNTLETICSDHDTVLFSTGSSKLYAHTYIESLYKSLCYYNFNSVVGVEAAIVPVNTLQLSEKPSIQCSQYISSDAALEEDCAVNILGVESVAFAKSVLGNIFFNFLHSSIDFSIKAQEESVPLISIERENDLVLTSVPKRYNSGNQISNLFDYSTEGRTKVVTYTDWKIYYPGKSGVSFK